MFFRACPVHTLTIVIDNIHVNNNEKKGVQFQSTKIVWALTKSTYIRTRLYMNVISSEKERGKEGEKRHPRDIVQQVLMAETERPACVRLWREFIELILFRGTIYVSRQTCARRRGHV